MAEQTKVANRAQRRAALTRSSLLKAGSQLLSERGFNQVTISDITDRADVALGSFYNHFNDREHMVTTVMHEARISQNEVIAKIMSELGTTGYGPLCSIVVAAVHRSILDPQYAGLVYNASLHLAWPSQEQLEALHTAVTLAISDSDLPVSVDFVVALIGYTSGTVLHPKCGPKFDSPQQTIGEMVTAMLRLVGATSTDIELWLERSLAIPIDLSVLENSAV